MRETARDPVSFTKTITFEAHCFWVLCYSFPCESGFIAVVWAWNSILERDSVPCFQRSFLLFYLWDMCFLEVWVEFETLPHGLLVHEWGGWGLDVSQSWWRVASWNVSEDLNIWHVSLLLSNGLWQELRHPERQNMFIYALWGETQKTNPKFHMYRENTQKIKPKIGVMAHLLLYTLRTDLPDYFA